MVRPQLQYVSRISIRRLDRRLKYIECNYVCTPLFIYAQDDRLKLFLMEYPLRTLAMVAQVQAGMWRRNGYAVINQVCRFKKSIFLCQLLKFSLKDSVKPQRERNILLPDSPVSSLLPCLLKCTNFQRFKFQTRPIYSRNSFSKINTYMKK